MKWLNWRKEGNEGSDYHFINDVNSGAKSRGLESSCRIGSQKFTIIQALIKVVANDRNGIFWKGRGRTKDSIEGILRWKESITTSHLDQRFEGKGEIVGKELLKLEDADEIGRKR